MSGKSTLLRQIALLHIMAQVSIVSFRSRLTNAESLFGRLDAMFLLCTPLSSLLTHCFLAWGTTIRSKGAFLYVISSRNPSYTSDDMDLPQTFSKEMQTMAMILAAMEAEGARCLIIVDELGRGTSPAEGVGIAHAIAERIIKAKVSDSSVALVDHRADAFEVKGYLLLRHSFQGTIANSGEISQCRLLTFGNRGQYPLTTFDVVKAYLEVFPG